MECIWCSILRNLHACGYHVPPSVEKGCSPCSSKRPDRKRSATNIFLSLDMLTERISLFAGPIATQSHTNSEPILSNVSSTINPSTFFFFDDILWGLYFYILFQIYTRNDFAWWNVRRVFERLSLMTDRKNTNTIHNQYTLKVSCLYQSQWK